MERNGWCVRLLSRRFPSSHICLVLGWSMPRVNSWGVVLHDSEAVCYQLNSLVCIVRTDGRYTVAGTTGSSTPVKPSQTQKCPLRILSLIYNRASEEKPLTATDRCVQGAKDLNQRLPALAWRRDHHRTTLFEFPTQNDCHPDYLMCFMRRKKPFR